MALRLAEVPTFSFTTSAIERCLASARRVMTILKLSVTAKNSEASRASFWSVESRTMRVSVESCSSCQMLMRATSSSMVASFWSLTVANS